MEIALLVGIVVLIVVTSVTSWLIYTQKTSLEQFIQSQQKMIGKLPELVQQATAAGIDEQVAPITLELKQLTQSIDVTNDKIGAVSGSIISSATEIGGLTKTYSETYKQFNQAVITLANPGTIQSWLEELPTVADPLTKIETSIANQYQTNRALLTTVGGLLEEWANQRGDIVASYKSIANSLNQLTTDEIRRNREADNQLRQQRKVLTEQSNRAAINLKEMSNQLEQLRNRVELMQTNAEQISRTTEHLITQLRDVAVKHQQSAKHLQDVNSNLRHYEDQLGVQIISVATRLNELGESNHKALSEFRREYSQVIQQLRTYQQESLLAQKSIVSRLQQQVEQLPTRRQQWIQTGLFATLTLVVLIAFVMQQMGG